MKRIIILVALLHILSFMAKAQINNANHYLKQQIVFGKGEPDDADYTEYLLIDDGNLYFKAKDGKYYKVSDLQESSVKVNFKKALTVNYNTDYPKSGKKCFVQFHREGKMKEVKWGEGDQVQDSVLTNFYGRMMAMATRKTKSYNKKHGYE
ncbi:MAG: hypothetical protein NTX03_14340 [Bacteroidetes bacterium]|nr:hypothetical protein [Bacteroidota bacterium]